MSGSRFLEVEPRRLPGWVERYVRARDGDVRAVVTAPGLDLVGGDGSLASVALLDPDRRPGAARTGDDVTATLTAEVAALAGASAETRTLLVCLVRRGGWSVGVVRDGVVLHGTTGRRYVQGVTAAGGWSQQRYARRRSGQAGKLAEDASSAVGRLLGLVPGPGPDAVVVAGDRSLAEQVLTGGPAAGLPRLGPVEVGGEPRRADLDAAAGRVLSLRVTVHDAPGPADPGRR